MLYIIVIFLIIIILVKYFQKDEFSKNRYNCVDCLVPKKFNRIEYSPKIAVVSLHVGDDPEYAKLTRKRLEDYCRIFDYDLYYFTEKINENTTNIWQKIDAVKLVLQKDYDYVVWFDSDILITKNKPVEDFIDRNSSIVLSRDIDVQNVKHLIKIVYFDGVTPYINSGFFIIKNDEIGKKFIDEILDGYNDYFSKNRFHEQSIMQNLFFKDYHPYTYLHSYGTMQKILGNPDYLDDSFCIHFAGMTRNARDFYVKKYF